MKESHYCILVVIELLFMEQYSFNEKIQKLVLQVLNSNVNAHRF